MLTVMASSRVVLRADALALLIGWQREGVLPCPAPQEDGAAVRGRMAERLRKGGRDESIAGKNDGGAVRIEKGAKGG